MPHMATESPGFTPAALYTAPNPVIRQHPRKQACSNGKSLLSLKVAASGMTIYSAKPEMFV